MKHRIRSFVINIECENDAFAEDLEGEVSRILADFSVRLRESRIQDEQPFMLQDENGNIVGMAVGFRDAEEDRQ